MGTTLLAALAASPASAQLGHVVKAQKISATSGGFSATLGEMDQFGRSIVNLGDLDGDGVTDLLVGAHTDDDGGLDKGSVYVLFLLPNGFVKSYQKISDLEGNFGGNLERGDQFGRAAARLGDLDGDGVTEIAVSANYDDDGGANKGAVYVLFLNTDGTVKTFTKISELSGGLPVTLNIHDEFGRSLSCLGDMDGDGVSDLLVGTPEDDEGGVNTGALHVLFLNSDGTVKNYRRISKFTDGLFIKPGDWFGFCSANIGDFDGDGVTDVAVGAVLDDDGGTNQGSVWILLLNSDGSVKEAHEIDELEGGFTELDDIDHFGTSVANIGDLDGDGVTDIAVGTVKDDDGGTPGNPDADVGAVYVLLMNPDVTVKQWVKISDITGDLPYSLDQWDWFGSAVAPLGGSPGDGSFNLAIGCRNDDDAGGNHGAVFLTQLNDGTVPVADFTVDRTLGVAPLTVHFTDVSQGNVTGWVWNFGSGAQSTVQNPSKTYSSPGTYTVQLTARGPTGNDLLQKAGLIEVVPGPLAAFDASPRTGDCPLTVQFTDLSEGTATSWLWDFGDGETSTERSPQHVYAECGSYTVTLTATGAGGPDVHTETDFVVVAPIGPLADFTATPTSGSIPLGVQFTDTSLNDVTAWLWDFGEGSSATTQNPFFFYAEPGTYTVSLTATGPLGSDVETKVDLVQVTGPPPTADFTATPTLGPEPLTVSFTDASTGKATAWFWDFGDGTTSTERYPVHEYPLAGLFSVSMTATGPGGSDTLVMSDLITVEQAAPSAAFTAAPAAGSAPLSVQFTDQSTVNTTGWAWDFGDGETSTEQNPAHVYDAVGVYTVSLTVTGPVGSDVLTQVDLVEVTPPVTIADFVASPTSGEAPLNVNFTDTSSGGVTAWLWDFGDGTTSTESSPVHLYDTVGSYDVTLSVTSPTGGDVLARTAWIVVREPAPTAAFAATPPSGLAPLTVQFEDQSSGPITQWAWDFGDGSSSRDPAPQHTYSVPGIYNVALTVTGPGGSDTLTIADAVIVSDPPPVADLTATPTAGVAPLTVQFTDASLGAVSAWAWDFGDGGTSTDKSPQYVYATPGTYTVTLAVTGPGGSDLTTRADLVVVSTPAPSAEFSAAPASGVAPLLVQFADLSGGVVTAWSWDLGDGTTSTAQSPSHEYTVPGSYTVALTATGPAGSDLETKVGFVEVQDPAPAAGFTADVTSGPAPLSVQFGDLSTGDVTAWSWDLGDGDTSSAQHPLHVYATPGTYTVSLTVTGPGGSDLVTMTDLVSVQEPPPAAGFTALPTSGFAPLEVQFTDATTGPVTAWSWEFGDGGTSTEQSPAYSFTTPGTYTVALTATGPGGPDVEAKVALVEVLDPTPVPAFTADVTQGFAPLAVQFTDTSGGQVTAWSWDLGDGGTSSEQHPAYSFATPGTYTVALTATGPAGAVQHVETDLVVVLDPTPLADFTLDTTSGQAPLAVQFTDASGGQVTAWSWDLGDGAISSEQSPAHVYATPGTYTVTLTATGPTGADVEVKADLVDVQYPPPVVDLAAAPTSGFAPLSVQFSDASTGTVTAWAWDLGDGGTSTEQAPLHEYTVPGTYTVALTVTGPGGSDATTRTGLVEVLDPTPVAVLGADVTSGWMPLAVQFSDQSTGQITAWLWDLGDGTTSSEQSPAHLYATAGTFTVSLTASGPAGSDVATAVDLITVVDGTPVAAFVEDGTTGLAPFKVRFTDQSTGNLTSRTWDFGDGVTSKSPNPLHIFGAPGTYTVSLTAAGPDGSDTLTKVDLVVVQDPVPIADFGASVTDGFAPLAVQFTDASTGDITAWSWDFGDGATSTEQDPLHEYADPGSYSVSLTTSGPSGSDTALKADLVAARDPMPSVDFAADPTSGPFPLPVQFTDATSGSVSTWLWDFGDGTTSTEPDPLHEYAAPGDYTVALTATGPAGSDTLSRPAFVTVTDQPPVAEFTADVTGGVAPLAVQFADLSTGVVTAWTWSFGDGNGSSAQNPLHVYADPGTYTVTLNAKNGGGGDDAVKTDFVVVLPGVPVASFTSTDPTGPVPWLVQFSDTSTGSVSAWLWDFGDGSTSTEQSPFHVYTLPGSYSVALTATGPAGADTRVETDLVLVADPPLADFTQDVTSGVAPLAVQFADTTDGLVTAWSWDFGDGGTSTEAAPLHSFATPGTWTVSLTVTGPGGSDTATRTDLVSVDHAPPTAAFGSTEPTGHVPWLVQFTDASAGTVTSRAWDFGDGGVSADANPIHVYTIPGTYSVSLTVTGPGGADTRVETDLVAVTDPPPVVEFVADVTSGPVPLEVSFTDVSGGEADTWTWDFGDGTGSSTQHPVHLYEVPGTYTVTLTASGPGGVGSETKTGFIDVAPAPLFADFRPTPFEGWAPLQVSFTDLSTGVITSRAWDFDDGQTSTLREPLHVFTEPGNYRVVLTLTGPDGTSTRARTITARDAPAFADGSFEQQTPELQPAQPWATYAGSSVRVRTGPAAADGGFPTRGSQWCDIGAEGTGSAQPPSNPGGPGTPSIGAAGIQQDFEFPVGATRLIFDAAFLLRGPAASTTRNDFMSVDVTDGTTSWNLLYLDTFDEFPLTSALHGLPMTEVRRVRVDLAELFPTADETTVLSLRASVGNVGGGANPSRGYVDGFRLAASPLTSFRNGNNTNPDVYSATSVVVGQTWGVTIDTTEAPGSTRAVLIGRPQAITGYPLAQGEVLIAGPRYFTLDFPLVEGRNEFQVPIPDEPALIGLFVATQVVLLGDGVVRGNAFDLVVGN